MSFRSRITFFVLLALLLQSCAAFRVDPAERLSGRWQSVLAGVPVVYEYSMGEVRVAGGEPVPFTLSEDRLSFVEGGSQVRILSFPSRSVMIQKDPLTGTEHRFTRL